ncbi:MAG: class I SAM-dependent methyltransferase [Thermomicrobiales bacterium]
MDEHRTGVSALEPEELELLGDLRGKRVLHLACSTCDEGITMASRGARVVGVDISETHVRVGLEKAEALGVEFDLRVGDMMNLDADLRDFDLVYISSGGICWVPDLDDWMTGVTNTLRPGGHILISEHHPIWETLGVAGDRQLTVLNDYFEQHELPEIVDPTKSAIGKAETSGDENLLQSFIWGIGSVVSALIRHDFQILALLELPDPSMFRGLGDAAACVPAVYRLMGKRG